LTELRAHIQKQKAFGTVVSALDEIAWLFNLRGSDIECNPVFFSYSIVSENDAILYLDLDKVTEEVKAHLSSDVTLKPYTQFFADLKELKLDGKKVLVNNKTSLAVEVAVGEVRNRIFFLGSILELRLNFFFSFSRQTYWKKDLLSPMLKLLKLRKN
jgi:Xaa-Pro aminopeptidase